ncbi:hypothetical protein C8F04DRAFT_17194 [Mycena alexandri]|uniref:AMP-activated protein kinase glycogen-binding domain-containing protein n=1 Tax=Mycena alexandri TaxID=1745969 RepID=A0AAD6TP03_9AGAR|nr:hypothetical protein C8F04DRAFT_17194 [Mycena alexandri]
MRSFLSSVTLGTSSARQPAKQIDTAVTFQPFVESRAMSDLYEAQFTWPSTEPSVVVVTGTFDEWSSSVHLVKETDEGGNTNNVLTSPPRPSGVSEAPVVANGDAKAKDTTIADFVDTVAARDGTTSALDYVTSALGAAIQSQIGVDPINGTQVAVEAPKPDAQFNVPEPPLADTPIAAPEPTMAPVVPISIVPVNADENNTSASATETQVAAEPSQPVETPSTHTPAPPFDALQAPAPLADAPSVPEVVVETVVPETKNIEAPAPSELPVSPSSEPPTVSAVVSEPTPEPAAISPVVSEPTPEPAATSVVVSEPTPEPAATSAVVSEPTPDPAAPSTVVSEEPPEPASTMIFGQESKTPQVAVAEAPSEPTTTEVAASEPISEPAVAAVSPEPASASPVPVIDPVATPAATEVAKPSTNGAAPTSTPKDVSSPSTPAASAPTTPAKKNGHAFPSSGTESLSSSTANSPSKFGTVGSRKNRKSIFGKIKGIFGNDKDKEEKEKK